MYVRKIESSSVLLPVSVPSPSRNDGNSLQAFYFEEALLEDHALPKPEREENFKAFFTEMIRDVVQTS